MSRNGEQERGVNPIARVAVRALGLAMLASVAVCVACGEPEPVAPSGPADPPVVARKRRAPNVLLVTLDTVRADALGAYGQPRPTTPELDQLAERGVLFEQVTTSQPETLPSHSTIFTGKQPYAHGVRSNGGFVLSERHTTLAEALSDAGYATGAEVAAVVLRKETQVTQGFDHYRGAESPGVEHKVVRYTQDPDRRETVLVRTGADVSARGIDFVRENRDRAFFLWLHYFDAHVPYSAPAIFNHKISGSPYHAEVASADFEVARVIRELERLGLREDTLIVVTSDHGEGLGEHGEVTHAYLVYDSTMRVPLIFSGLRDLPAGRRVAAPVRTADIAPTILDLLGLPPLRDVQGVSLLRLVKGEADDLQLLGYGESTRFNATFDLSMLRFVREGRWKYIHKVKPELYDVDVDPKELVDLAPIRPDVVDRLRGELAALLASAPAKPADAQAKVDADLAEQLIALGYVARSPVVEVADDVESLAFAEGAEDPTSRIADVERLSEADGMMSRGLFDAALERLEPLAERNPDSAYVLASTGSALLGLGRTGEAVEMLRRALLLEPANTDTVRSLSSALVSQGDRGGAVEVLAQAAESEPCNETIVVDLGARLRELGRYAELVELLESTARACPEMSINLNNYAWALATLPIDDLRDGPRAVEVVRGAIERSGRRDPAHLDTLAAALAESGDFEGARAIASEALLALRTLGAPAEVLTEVEAHLASFTAGKPLRVP